MKRNLTLLCLILTACGTFEINVRMLPKGTETASPVASASAGLVSTPTQSETATATALAQATPTADLPAGQPITLVTIQMMDSNSGWAVESSGRIVKTGSGGATWQNRTPFQGIFDQRGLFAFNADTVWAVPSQPDVSNVVWRTQDGGVTWEASQSLPLGDGKYRPLNLQFPNARDGWLLLLAKDELQGSQVVLYQSGDGGENWEQVSSLNRAELQSYLPAMNTSMSFFDGQTGWLGGWWGKDDPTRWQILKTADGGLHWDVETLSIPGEGSLACNGRPVVEAAPRAMAVDISCTQADNAKFFYHHLYYLSSAGSPAWRSWKVNGKFLSVDFINASQGWMMTAPGGSLNEIYRTNDGGKTWVNINVVAWAQAYFNFVNSNLGWAIVSDGSAVALVHTINGGQTWSEIKPLVANQ